MTNIADRIWITSRVRMLAERKATRRQNASYLAVTYYSLFTVILSVFSKYYVVIYPFLNELNLSASVVVLVASLVSGGFRFETKATAYRECYLKLQKLMEDGFDDKEKSKRYTDILWDYPNHTDNDYYDLIINHTYWEGKKLNVGDIVLKPTLFMWASYVFRHVTYYCVLAALFLAPAGFLAWPLLWKA